LDGLEERGSVVADATGRQTCGEKVIAGVGVQTDKSEIRKEMRARRKALSPAAKARASAVVCEKILLRNDVRNVCAVYLSSSDEIDLTEAIRGLLARGVVVVAPRWNGETYELAKLKGLGGEDLREGPMGILEPKESEIVSPKEVAAWLVPGLAFTRDGARLGYGGGWYDRLMADADTKAVKLGVAHAFQVVESLPREAHDVRLDGVVADDRAEGCLPNGRT